MSGTISKLKEKARATLDGWVNAFTGLGTAMHDAIGSTYSSTAQNKSPEYYENLIRTNALARRIAKLPAREMLRQGYDIEVAGDSNYDERPVMEEVERLQLDVAQVWALTLARATGGAVIVPMIDDGVADLREPLRLDAIREIRELKVLSRRCATRATMGGPIFRISYPNTTLPVVEMHESRLLVFEGVRVTDDVKAGNAGWSDSIFVSLEETLARLGTSWQALGNMLVDGSLGVLKLKGFHELVSGHAEGDEAMRTRFRLMAHGRSVARALALDADAEDFTWQNRSFAGIPDSLYAMMSEISSETGIPITKLFGRSAAGMNATGEGDERDWNNEVVADRRESLEPQHRTAIRWIMRQKKPGLGAEPKQWSVAYNPLRQLSDAEQAEVRLKTSQADTADITSQILTPEEVAISRYGGKRYSTRTVIDAELRQPPEGEDAGMPGAGGNAEDVQKTVLNGAQIAELVGVVKSVAAGEIPRESGLEIIMLSVGIDEVDAEKLLADAGNGFKPTPKEQPNAPPAGAPAPGGGEKPPPAGK